MIYFKKKPTHVIIEEKNSESGDLFTSIAREIDDRGLFQIFTTVPLKVKHADAFENHTIELEDQIYEIQVKRIDLAVGFLHISIEGLENAGHFSPAFDALLDITAEILHNQEK